MNFSCSLLLYFKHVRYKAIYNKKATLKPFRVKVPVSNFNKILFFYVGTFYLGDILFRGGKTFYLLRKKDAYSGPINLVPLLGEKI